MPSPAYAESRRGPPALLGPLWQKGEEFALVMGQVPKHKTSLRQSRGQACAGESRGVGGFPRYCGHLRTRGRHLTPVDRLMG